MDVDPELATLVRERLDERQPRLPSRFIPPPERPGSRRRVAAVAVAAFLLGVGVAILIRPAVSTIVPSGVLGLPPAATPTPAAPVSSPRGALPGGGPASRALPPGASSSPSPTPDAGPTSPATAGGGAPPAGAPAPTATPAPQQSAPITIQVTLPPLLPTPKPSPTSSGICLLGIVCVKT